MLDICQVTAKTNKSFTDKVKKNYSQEGIYVSYTQNERRHLQETQNERRHLLETVTWERHVTVKVDMSFTVTVTYERHVQLHPKRGTCNLLTKPHGGDTSFQERHDIS